MTTTIQNYNYSESQITMLVTDSAEYVWMGFTQDANGNCAIQKVSASDPTQKYFDIDLATNVVKRGFIFGNYIYIALDDNTLIGKRYSLLNPLSLTDTFTIPAGVTEAPVDVLAYGSYVYFLIPGDTSGKNAKICIFSLSGTFDQTVDLATITNAKSFTIDTSTSELWVATYASPAKYVRVYQASGSIWSYTAFT